MYSSTRNITASWTSPCSSLCTSSTATTPTMTFLRTYVAGASTLRQAAAVARLNQRMPALLPLASRTISSTSRVQARVVKPLPSSIPNPATPHQEAVNPYAGGPSAIDKAVHFFFLTELLRGASPDTTLAQGHLLSVS